MKFSGIFQSHPLEQSNEHYELGNHLGNVLAVVTDNIHMADDLTTATVASASYYYPFGLQMDSRTVNDGDYRLGFNGKERDASFGVTNYDYGFRIYNPRVAKFLSVDPLTKSYPMLTPYQFASNTPIAAIDLDGLEAQIAIYAAGRTRIGGNYKSDRPLFKMEADRDVEQGVANSSTLILSTKKFIQFLEQQTKDEGSIQYLSIFSHSTPNGIILDNGEQGYEAIDINGRNWEFYGYKNNIGISDIANNPNIVFEDGALCVFAGCNAGKSTKKQKIPIAIQFTFETGVASIAADGLTSPQGPGHVRKADYNYYLYQKTKSGKILKTALGKELTQEKIRSIYNYLNRDKEVLKLAKTIGIKDVIKNNEPPKLEIQQ
jgi:RHS repeat-associated protein